jgi:uncharacterized membrane protein SirB2
MLIPVIAMRFTKEVNWNINDFLRLLIFLLFFVSGFEVIKRKSKSRNQLIFGIVILALIILLLWIDLAVGIFNLPFSGN